MIGGQQRAAMQVRSTEVSDSACINNETYKYITTEILNSVRTSSLHPHRLRLKVGSVVMLLRNLDVISGMFNDTCFIVKKLKRKCILCTFATGCKKGKDTLKRTQFPAKSESTNRCTVQHTVHQYNHAFSIVPFKIVRFASNFCRFMTLGFENVEPSLMQIGPVVAVKTLVTRNLTHILTNMNA
uniref:ATP-dependent DNA helicase n=1 Tax=Caenorhabditis japonica TaxID=281687 RepID=A0A8R1ID96_CAEJA